MARSGAGREERPGRRTGVAQTADPDGPLGPVAVRALGAAAALRPAEVRQHVGVLPAGAPVGGPAVEVGLVPPGPDLGVDGGAAAQRPAAREEDPAVVQAGLFGGGERPVVGRAEQLGEGRRNADLDSPVRAARLDQQDLAPAVLAEPVGEDAPGRTRPDDHVVHALDAHTDAPGTVAFRRPASPRTTSPASTAWPSMEKCMPSLLIRVGEWRTGWSHISTRVAS